jgi:hypothetical protein
MARKSTLSDGKNRTKVFSGIYELEAPYPTVSEENAIIFREFLTLDGNGTTDSMKVNGSAIAQNFYVQAETDYDIYITAICFYISADLVIVDLVEFGNLPALTNGCSFFYESQDTGQIIISEPIKSNFDLLKMSNFKPSFGIGASAFQLDNATATVSEGYMPVVYFSDYGFGEDGLLLSSGTTDKIVFTIRDNLNVGASSISVFNAIAHGFKRKVIS